MKHKLTYFIILCSLLKAFHSYGQADSTKWKLKLNDCKLSIGYFYQGEHFGEVGLRIDLIQDKTKKKQNVSLIPGGQITKHNKSWYVNPFITLRYFKPITYKISIVTSVSYNYRQILNIISSSITPEIGINFNHNQTLSYGYNFFPDNKYSWTFPHRVALRLALH